MDCFNYTRDVTSPTKTNLKFLVETVINENNRNVNMKSRLSPDDYIYSSFESFIRERVSDHQAKIISTSKLLIHDSY